MAKTRPRGPVEGLPQYRMDESMRKWGQNQVRLPHSGTTPAPDEAMEEARRYAEEQLQKSKQGEDKAMPQKPPVQEDEGYAPPPEATEPMYQEPNDEGSPYPDDGEFQPEGEQDYGPEGQYQDDGEGQEDLPYGYQVLCRLHDLLGDLLMELDGHMGPLEHTEVKAFLHGHMGEIDKAMSVIGALGNQHYGHLPPIDGDMGDIPAGEDMTVGGEQESLPVDDGTVDVTEEFPQEPKSEKDSGKKKEPPAKKEESKDKEEKKDKEMPKDEKSLKSAFSQQAKDIATMRKQLETVTARLG